jgi:bifunctional non-homologous end joining protein LigD
MKHRRYHFDSVNPNTTQPKGKTNMQTLEQPKLENITLYYREGSSDKIYQCSIKPQGDLFVVNFAYGRRGSTLNTGTKTSSPVEYDEAKAIYDKLVQEKKAKGYTEGENGTPYTSGDSDKQSSGLLPQLLNPIDEKTVDILLHDPNWCLQEKFDGRHLLIRKQGAVIHGINKKGIIVGLPLPVFNAVQQFNVDLVLDGESIGDVFHCFDILELDGVGLQNRSYRQRLVSLMNLLASFQQTAIRHVETHYTKQQKLWAFDELKSAKKEGAVFKRLDAPYKPGRPNSGGTQLKHKFYATLSAVVAKINQQRSVEIRLLNGEGWIPCGNVTIPANHQIPKVGQVVEVRYLYAHRQSNVLYQPTYLGPRDDVEQAECLLTQVKYKPQEEAC